MFNDYSYLLLFHNGDHGKIMQRTCYFKLDHHNLKAVHYILVTSVDSQRRRCSDKTDYIYNIGLDKKTADHLATRCG